VTPRTILITGGTGKLGRSLVSHFLASGDSVIATARTENSLGQLIKEHSGVGEKLTGFQVDLRAPRAINNLCEQLQQKRLSPDCLVNSARSQDFLKINDDGLISRENFAGEFLLDVIVPYELTMALVAQDGGRLRRVVNVGSQYGTVAANPHLYADSIKQSPLHYGVAKAALVHLTKELAVRLATQEIQVNCVAFGGVEGRVDADFKKRYQQLCPLGRMLRDDEVAGPVDMLLSDYCSGVTGHVLAVDGGWTIW
jgi:NAD(P)-dependent dehydrogenase (short-subunit alcohol dehydrogenase family)